jgi:hypothetical protein
VTKRRPPARFSASPRAPGRFDQPTKFEVFGFTRSELDIADVVILAFY